MSARVLLALNEDPEGCKTDLRDAVAALRADGLVEAHHVYPFSARLSDGLSDGQVWNELIVEAGRFQPTVLIFFHTHTLRPSPRSLQTLRSLPSSPRLGYCEGDAYQTWYKPLPEEARTLAGACDTLFLPGALRVIPQYRRAGARDIRYVPNAADERYLLTSPPASRPFDVVMVANRVHSRVPLRTMPGARTRLRLAQALMREHGRRFALIGYGWPLPSARKPVPQPEAPAMLQLGRVAVGNSHLSAAHCFSNRFPVTIFSGVAQVHESFHGAADQFSHARAIRWFEDVDEALRQVRHLLALPHDDLDQAAQSDRETYGALYSTRAALRYMIDCLQALHDDASSPANPWIADGRF